MPDPYETVAPDGTIATGARLDRVPSAFEPVIETALDAVDEQRSSLYLYGSVANGTAHVPTSDVDFLAIDLDDAREIATQLSKQFAALCRGVEIASARTQDFRSDTDEGYGNRVFLRHYCVHLTGPDPAATLPRFPADRQAARGFNGDIARSLDRWRTSYASDEWTAAATGVRVARKSLLAVAGMVSVHDGTWTTDRAGAARRWAEIESKSAAEMDTLNRWASGEARASKTDVTRMLAPGGPMEQLVDDFRRVVGCWDAAP